MSGWIRSQCRGVVVMLDETRGGDGTPYTHPAGTFRLDFRCTTDLGYAFTGVMNDLS